ncbi:MAG: hypothetical protein JNL92_24890 [Opitutaceae bacterium]|nr:hypothetical protein [Opitutaceae bacterium]
MTQSTNHLSHARALRADILAAPAVWLPRRDVLVQWLDGFLLRARAPAYAPDETETADLQALDLFLRGKMVPVAAA